MNMKTCKLLFQGDSITDADRVRENPLDLGTGYPYYAAQLLRSTRMLISRSGTAASAATKRSICSQESNRI